MVRVIPILLGFSFIFSCVSKKNKTPEEKVQAPNTASAQGNDSHTAGAWQDVVKSSADKILAASQDYLNSAGKVVEAVGAKTWAAGEAGTAAAIEAGTAAVNSETGQAVIAGAAQAGSAVAAATSDAINSPAGQATIAAAAQAYQYTADTATATVTAISENPNVQAAVAYAGQQLESGNQTLQATLTSTAAYVNENHPEIVKALSQCVSCITAGAVETLNSVRDSTRQDAERFRNISTGLFFIPVAGLVSYGGWVAVQDWRANSQFKRAMLDYTKAKNLILGSGNHAILTEAFNKAENELYRLVGAERTNLELIKLLPVEDRRILAEFGTIIFDEHGGAIRTAKGGNGFTAATTFEKLIEEGGSKDKFSKEALEKVDSFINKYLVQDGGLLQEQAKVLGKGTENTRYSASNSRQELQSLLQKRSPLLSKDAKIAIQRAEAEATENVRKIASELNDLRESVPKAPKKIGVKFNKWAVGGLVTAVVATGAFAIYAEYENRQVQALGLADNPDCNAITNAEARYICKLNEAVDPLLAKSLEEQTEE